MKTLSRITDCALGHLGLFLIGAISWTADRLSTSGPEAKIPTRMVPIRSARRQADRRDRSHHPARRRLRPRGSHPNTHDSRGGSQCPP